jgi:cell division GTPase FtsZ
MDYDIDQEFENSYEQTNMLMVGVGESGCQTVAVIAKEFGMPGLRPVLADKRVAFSSFRFVKAERIDLDVEWREDYKRCLQGVNYVFILVKLGGEHEINTVKIMAEVTADMKVPFVVFARMPSRRLTSAAEQKAADNAFEMLRRLANASVVIPDDTLFQTIPNADKLTVKVAYERATKWFAEAVAGVARPFAAENISDTNAARLEWLVKRKNATCSVGFGWGSGSEAVDDAIERLKQSPFLKGSTKAFAVDAALVIVSVAPNVTNERGQQALRQVKGIFDETILLQSCLCVDTSLEEDIRITALLRATEQAEAPEPPVKPDADTTKQSAEPSRRRTRKSKGADNQMMLVFREDDLGIFSAKEPTKYCGENLDLPTYSRLNL